MSDIWNARREKLQAELARAALELAEHTGAEAFSIPIAGTTPAMVVSLGRAPDAPVADEDCTLCNGMGMIDRQAPAEAAKEQRTAQRHLANIKKVIAASDGSLYLSLLLDDDIEMLEAFLAARQVGAPDGAVARDAARYRWVRAPSSGNIVYAMAISGECGRNMDITIDQYLADQEKAQ